jgi:hypothetical protein
MTAGSTAHVYPVKVRSSVTREPRSLSSNMRLRLLVRTVRSCCCLIAKKLRPGIERNRRPRLLLIVAKRVGDTGRSAALSTQTGQSWLSESRRSPHGEPVVDIPLRNFFLVT